MPHVAYLVIRDGTKWSDVFRLIPGRTVTIGRGPTNHIVIREDQASRQHAEIFINNGNWTIRDLDSRNGTLLGEERLIGDRDLRPGDVIWIARTKMEFVDDLSDAYPEATGAVSARQTAARTGTGRSAHRFPCR